jgi:hypothetical protein
MPTAENDRDVLRTSKEFVYDQWRKLLCIFVIGDDISTNQFALNDVTSEKIRTIFNNGYKLAMLQTKSSLMKELSGCSDPIQSKMIKGLICEIDDRIETSRCLATYKKSHDETLYESALKRENEFSRYKSEDVTRWTNRQM